MASSENERKEAVEKEMKIREENNQWIDVEKGTRKKGIKSWSEIIKFGA